MPLEIDGYYVDPINTENPDSIMYRKIRDVVLNNYKNFPIVLKVPQERMIRDEEKPDKFHIPGGVTIHYNGTFYQEGYGIRSIRYYEEKYGKEGENVYNPSYYLFLKQMVLQKDKPELAVFMLWFYPHLKNSLNPAVNSNGLGKLIEVLDPARESRLRIEESKNEIILKNKMLIEADELTVRKIANAYQLQGVLKIDLHNSKSEAIPHDAEGNITGEYKGEIPYVMTEDQVRITLWDFTARKAKTSTGFYSEILNLFSPSADLMDGQELLDNLKEFGLVKCALEERKPNGPLNIWRFTKESYKGEPAEKRKVLYICGHEQKTIEEAERVLVIAFNTNPTIKTRAKTELDRFRK